MTERELENLKDLPAPAPGAEARARAIGAAMAAFESGENNSQAATQGTAGAVRSIAKSHPGTRRTFIPSVRTRYAMAASLLAIAVAVPAVMQMVARNTNSTIAKVGSTLGSAARIEPQTGGEPKMAEAARETVQRLAGSTAATGGPKPEIAIASRIGQATVKGEADGTNPGSQPAPAKPAVPAAALTADPAMAKRGQAMARAKAPAAVAAAAVPETGLADIAIGRPDAPVTVVAYASLTCPHCAAFAIKVLPEIKAKYIDTGTMRFVSRDFPLDPLAAAAAMLTHCVDGAKAFALVETLFATQSQWAAGPGDANAKLFEVARRAGFTQDSFDACLKDQALLDRLTAARAQASATLGIDATPTFIVNGQRVTGIDTVEDLDKVVAPLLARQKSGGRLGLD